MEPSDSASTAMEEPDSLEVLVKTLDSQTRTFIVGAQMNVKEFKEHIAASVSIPSEKQRLIYQGRVLQDDKKLQEYSKGLGLLRPRLLSGGHRFTYLKGLLCLSLSCRCWGKGHPPGGTGSPSDSASFWSIFWDRLCLGHSWWGTAAWHSGPGGLCARPECQQLCDGWNLQSS